MDYIYVGIGIIIYLAILIGFYHYEKFWEDPRGLKTIKEYYSNIRVFFLIMFFVGMFMFSYGCRRY